MGTHELFKLITFRNISKNKYNLQWNKKSPHRIQNVAPKCSFFLLCHPSHFSSFFFLNWKKLLKWDVTVIYGYCLKRERKMRTFRYRSALKKENISIIFYYFQHDRFWDFNHEFLLLTEIKITLKKMRAETFSTNSRPLDNIFDLRWHSPGKILIQIQGKRLGN